MKDLRHIRHEGKPIFVVYHYAPEFEKMGEYWNLLAKEQGLEGIQLIYRYDQIQKIPENDITFTYEPVFSGWGGTAARTISKINRLMGKSTLRKFDYDEVWKKLLNNASKQSKRVFWHGAFVGYDDTPRRGGKGTIISGATPEKFKKYISSLLRICEEQYKEFIFLTAWNEWGEGAYLEPDVDNKYTYLTALNEALKETGNI